MSSTVHAQHRRRQQSILRPAVGLWYDSPMLPAEPVLRRSHHLSVFAHMGDVFLYHDLYGYIMKMSPDVLAFLDAFRDGANTNDVCARYKDSFEGQSPEEFASIFSQFSCLNPPDEDEVDGIFYMVPVKSKWNVWTRDGDDNLTIHTAWGQRPHARHTLTPEETAVWDAIDGERRLNEFQGVDRALLKRLIPKLVHHEIQAVKLSAFPVSTFKGRRSMRPPYLTSTMPYPPYRPGEDTGVTPDPGKQLSPGGYYREQVHDADAQFDHRETTLSHLLRVPHPALRERTYGQALVDSLLDRELLPTSGEVRVLEIGAGLGYVARDSLTRLRDRGMTVNYHILELSPALASAQRQRLNELDVTIKEGDVLQTPLPKQGYDFILANEMIGDLPAVELTRTQVGFQLPDDSPERKAALDALGPVGQLIRDYGINLNDAPETFYLTTGAIQLLGRLYDALAPGGLCILTEFGELNTYPRLSVQLDHPELSIHFGHMSRAAETAGFEVKYEFIIDLLDFERTLEGMATTRSYFKALSMMLAEHGIELPKIGYTRQMFNALITGKLDGIDIGELYFDRIEDRLMGLVPHEFKALLLRRPA